METLTPPLNHFGGMRQGNTRLVRCGFVQTQIWESEFQLGIGRGFNQGYNLLGRYEGNKKWNDPYQLSN